jgi:hypothetical protein
MSILLQGIAALAAGALVVGIGVRLVSPVDGRPPLDEPLSDAPYQRLARRGL